MSKKNSAPKISLPKQAGNKKQQQKVFVQKQSDNKRKQWLVLAVLAVVTFAVFYPSLKCEFTNWDDGTYVTENPMIWKLDGKAIKEIFSTPVSLNYHPLTMLSLAIDYKLGKLNPYYYHLNNVLIHILNTLLVFVFIRMFMEGYNRSRNLAVSSPPFLRRGQGGVDLTPSPSGLPLEKGESIHSRKSENFRPDPFNIALIVSTFFGIHPMRVESVTWVAERKDVLYMFFFLLSLIAYIYPDPKGRKGLTPFRAGATFIFFICSCLSKGMGVVLPVVLVLIDWFYGDAKTLKQIFQSCIKKAHFFVAAAVFGVVAFEIQSHGAIAAMGTFTLFQRLTFGCYGFIMYIYKLLLPINLSAFYPYPFTDDHGNIPPIYYASPFIVLFIALAIFFILRKNETIGKVLAFGFSFYFITIALVLQFLSVGSVIMADRYAYASYTGIFFIIGFSFEYVRKYFSASISNLFAGVLIVSAGYFSYLTHERAKVWTNAETLWTDAMNQFPFIEIAYENRGIYYKDHNELDKMQKDYEIITGIDQSKIKLAPTRNEKIWSNLGNLYGLQQKFDKSLDAYSHAIEINPKNSGTYLNRAITYSMMKQYEKSIPDYDKSIELASDVALTYKNRAYTLLQLGQYDKSISDYDKAIQLYPYDTVSVLNRGIAKFNAQKFEDAITDFKNYIKMVPNSAEANYNASIASKNLNRFSEALQFAQRAAVLKYPVSQQYMDELRAKVKSQ